jgi:DNA-directed RNA polymerase subunit RPC12/RpoP
MALNEMPKKPKKKVVVSHTDHPAAHRKVRCPHCAGYAIGDAHNDKQFVCSRCGRTFNMNKF